MTHLFKTKMISALIALAVVFALTGCGADNQAAKAGTSKQGKHYVLNVGYAQGGAAPLLDIAIQEGFFKDQNLTVNPVPFASSADGLNGLQSGKIDVGSSFGTAAPLTFIANGADFSIIGGNLEGGSPVLVKKKDKDKYKSLKDFKGKKIGTIRMFTSDIVFRSALSKAGISWKKDLDMVEFKNGSDLLQAITSGKVDVAVGAPSSYTKAKEAGLAVVAWSNDLGPGHVCCRIVVKTDSIAKNREAYIRLEKGLILAERVKNANPKTAVKDSKPYLKLGDKEVNTIVNEPHSHFSTDPNSNEVLKMWKQMQAIGYVKNVSNLNIKKHIKLDIYQEALKELIKEHPKDKYFKEQLNLFDKQNTQNL